MKSTGCVWLTGYIVVVCIISHLPIADVTLHSRRDPNITCSDTLEFNAKADCTADYPNFKGHLSLLAKHLSLDLYQRLRTVSTSTGFTIDKAIQNGVGNPDFKVGVLAGDEETYTVFSELFDPIIRDYHNGFIRALDKHISDLNPDHLTGSCDLDPNYVVSSRIRAARNLRGFCLSPYICPDERQEVERIIRKVFSSLNGEYNGDYFDLPSMLPKVQQQLIEDHILFDPPVSRHFMSGGMARDFPANRGIWYSKDNNVTAWINEEDHLRLITMEKGGNLKRVFHQFCRFSRTVENLIKENGAEFMWNEHLGYISTCPTNLGTGVRCSVHVKLPRLSRNINFARICKMLRVQVRGAYGELKKSDDRVLDISNLDRLGLSEVEIVQLVVDGVGTLIELEKHLDLGKDINDVLA